MKLLKRIKNLWQLSAYIPEKQNSVTVLKKEVPTIKKKLATIIQTDEKDILTEEINNDNPNK